MIIMIIIIIIIVKIMMMIMTTVIIKAQFENIFNFLIAPRTVSDTYAPVAPAQSCADHVQHIDTCNTPCYVPRGTKGQLSC